MLKLPGFRYATIMGQIACVIRHLDRFWSFLNLTFTSLIKDFFYLLLFFLTYICAIFEKFSNFVNVYCRMELFLKLHILFTYIYM